MAAGKLPAGWSIGLPPALIAEVETVERYSARGLFITTKPDHKGYLWVRLCVGHPYASRTGWQRLHRYLIARKLGRRLFWYEHVHHDPRASKATVDVRQLELTEACDHGHYHMGRRVRCGHELALWKPRDARGRFTPMPTDESVRAATENVNA